uniref:Gypsy retrotransposon integrase-like protein 1 n=1 Tax=Anabas testudineus TaxID=64144 RepID=A0A7N6BLW2_ANATE
MCFVPRQSFVACKSNQFMKMTTVKIKGDKLRALIDTGNTQTLVHRQYVPPNVICTLETIPICCVHGDEKPYPTADLYIEVQGQAYLLNVGVADNLPFPVVLGHDLPVLVDLLGTEYHCNVAVTRAQAKHVQEHSPTLSALPFYAAELETQPGKSRKSRSQRRTEKLKRTAVDSSVETAPDMPLGFPLPTNIIEMQQNDPTLSTCLLTARETGLGTEPDNKEEYFLQNGILYHQQGQTKQLVVPQEARDIILNLGHSIPWAGHLGKHKTTARIRRHFYWPGLHRDVAQFCKSCPQCQKTFARVPSRAPLYPLPIIGTPFERLGMDIVGPVEKSKAGNRYMLVITDYATKYPEVFPLKSVKAKAVAFSLVQFFSRVGFPREILTDQGTNFMSTLLKQVYKLLGIVSVRTTPYHPQTDGLTERFNQILKQMLRKFVNETGSDWDQWLPCVLFAYREVPQASTGFSPFELLYGHEMREKLQKMSELAQAHMKEAQKCQKTWYDKSARQRSFEPGQKVLVMLPTSDRRKQSSRVLHVNLLKEWIPRVKEGVEVLLIQGVKEEEEMDDQYLPSSESSELDVSHLSEDQNSRLR